jgi:hypothetical protein
MKGKNETVSPISGVPITLTGVDGSTKVSIYRSPLQGSRLCREKVAAFVVIPDLSMREGGETRQRLRQRGVDCVAGYTVLPGELVRNRDKAKEFLKKANIHGAILMRLVGDEEKTSYSPGTVWYAQPYYPSFWGYWNYGWSTVYMPGYQWTDRVITLETLIYSIDTDALLWAGRSESTNPKDIRKFVKDLVDAAGKEMRHAGLVKQ